MRITVDNQQHSIIRLVTGRSGTKRLSILLQFHCFIADRQVQ